MTTPKSDHIIAVCFMKIDVSDLLKSLGAELKVNESERISLAGDDVELTSPVTVALKLVNTGGTVLVTGTLKTSVKLNCVRCLKEFDQPVSIKIEEEYAKKVPSRKADKDEEIELKDEDFVFEIGEDNVIDLDEAIRQNTIVSLPIKPLCDKACKLKEPTKEKGKKIDPRLAKLTELKIGVNKNAGTQKKTL